MSSLLSNLPPLSPYTVDLTKQLVKTGCVIAISHHFLPNLYKAGVASAVLFTIIEKIITAIGHKYGNKLDDSGDTLRDTEWKANALSTFLATIGSIGLVILGKKYLSKSPITLKQSALLATSSVGLAVLRGALLYICAVEYEREMWSLDQHKAY